MEALGVLKSQRIAVGALLVSSLWTIGCSGTSDSSALPGAESLGTGSLAGAQMADPVAGGQAPTLPVSVESPQGPVVPALVSADVEPREPLAARLTKTQYRYTVQDLFGILLGDEDLERLPNEFIAEAGFENTFDAQRSTTAHVTGYAVLGESVAEQVDVLALAERWASCANLTPDCEPRLIQSFTRRMFRRPATATEVESISRLIQTISAEYGGAVEPTLQALLSGLLQFPQFLYRMESETLGTPGRARRLTAYELASRLSYFLWQSTPDDALLDFADNVAQGVAPIEAFSTQVERLLQDTDKVARTRASFWGDYTLASSAAYPTATPEVAAALGASVVATINRATGPLGDEKPLTDLFTTREFMLTPELAALMGLQSKGSGLMSYDATDANGRIGVFTHPGFLAGIGSTSFVARGVVMTDRLLCQAVVPAPASIAAQIEDTLDGSGDLSPREASDFRFALGGSCEGCHKTFEPVAFALERYDILGRYVEEDEGGRALFTNGYLQGRAGERLADYEDASELMQLLSEDDRVPRCFAKNAYIFGQGREFRPPDDAAVDAVLAAAQAHSTDLTFTGLLRAVALSPQLSALTVVPGQ